MIKLIIFDWDDVFTLGSTKGYYACYHAAMEGVGVSLSLEEEKRRIDSKWGSPHRQEIEALLIEHPELVEKAIEVYESALFGDTFVNELSLVKGGNELLHDLSASYELAVASGVHPKLLKENVFRKFYVPDVFSAILTSYDLDDPEKSKPHPHAIEMIMEKLNVKPNETVMVGDATNDMMMAKSAEVTSVAVLTGHLSRQQAEDLNVDHILEDVTHLRDLYL